MPESFKLVSCEFIPSDLQSCNFYYSSRFRTSAHLCACGCGSKIVLPIRDNEWHLQIEEDGFTLDPSVGNREFACRSHYRIIEGRLKWYQPMSDREVELSRARDLRHRQRVYPMPKKKLWERLLGRLKGFIQSLVRLGK